MPEPKEVNPENFTVSEIVYNLNGFSIAWGTWEDTSEERLGMRWNGEGEDAGYPKTFGHPVWFMLPRELSIPFLNAIDAKVDIYRRTKKKGG